MLDAFKLKPFDLEPVYASWTTAPRFLGDPKKDPPVDEWLKEIKEGCLKHNVPQEYWHTYVWPIHFGLVLILCLGALSSSWGRGLKQGDYRLPSGVRNLFNSSRLNELKKVMAQVHGGRYWWNWKKFKVAMNSMSCKFLTKALRYLFVLTKYSRAC